MIGQDVEVTILDVRNKKVRLGITAPRYIPVHRKEVYEAIHREKAGERNRQSLLSCNAVEFMKIAVTSTGPTLEHYVGTRARRCGYLLIVDPDTMQYEVVQNPLVSLWGPAAGKLFAQLVLQNDVHTILAGSCGDNTLKALRDAGIKIFVGMTGSVRRAVEQFKRSYSAGVS